MYGLISKIRTLPGRAEELGALLAAETTPGSGSLPGNLSYVVARDTSDPDVLWVSEAWVDEASHAASLRLASVQAAFVQGRPLIAGFEQRVETRPLPDRASSRSRAASPAGQYLLRLYHHGAWADARLVGAVRMAPRRATEALRELAHVRGSQETWLARVLDRAPRLAIWPDLDLPALERVGPPLDDALLDLVRGADEASLARVVVYRNRSGEQRTPLSDILFHLAMHGQYHRGKANAALRAAGAEPVNVDVITWSRAGSPAPRGPERQAP